MNEKTLLKIAIFLSLSGLISLFVLSGNTQFDVRSIGSITPDGIGRGVKVCGTVENKFTSRKGHIFFTLADDSGSLQIVVFNSTGVAVNSKTVCVTGMIALYKGDLEIIAQEVENV